MNNSDSVKILTRYEASTTTSTKVLDLFLKFDSACMFKNIQTTIENKWMYARLWVFKNIFVEKKQLDQSLKYIEVVKMEENVTAWIDRVYRYVNVPDYLKKDTCKLVRHAHRISPTTMIYQLFQKPTNFSVYLLAPGDNSPLGSLDWDKEIKNSYYFEEGVYRRGDGAFRVHFSGRSTYEIKNKRNSKNSEHAHFGLTANPRIPESGHQDWYKNWTLMTTDTENIDFSRSAVDTSYHDRIKDWLTLYHNVTERVCNQRASDYCDCYAEKFNVERLAVNMHGAKEQSWFAYGQTPNITQINNGENREVRDRHIHEEFRAAGSDDGMIDCRVDYLEKYDIFKKDFFDETQLLILAYGYTWMGGVVFCEN